MSKLEDQLQHDLTAAMKARDELATSTLRMVRAALMNVAVAGAEAIELGDDQVIDVLRSEAKKRSEAAEVYAAAGRTESAAKELAERAVIERYLPAAMGDDELATIVAEEIARAAADGVTGPKGTGVVIKAVRERVGTGADGARIAASVKALLA
ncbi:MAG TPA: GatB/YqeY domain-containing protein [Ilumatobacteraceae bacterium]|nr:GatB/YqeY domain-containing protein [Ilumatobacteraceae bacterium]